MNLRTIVLTTTTASLLLGAFGLATLARADFTQADSQATQQMQQNGQSWNGAERGRHPRGRRLAAAAVQLGVTEAELRTALGLPEQPIEPDIAAAATQLGTTAAELQTALGNSRLEGQGPRGRRPDFAAVAEQYGVTEADLRTALGIPAERPQPDLVAAAQQLGVSEADLRDALGGGCPQGGVGRRGPGQG